mmetsp:Transcript_41668/g.69616  ORF Transcript_41668/g.69616 Transcript_41668/m.69616 type:complete len:203 (+) Transcript_41668:284-892(+)
MPRLLTRCEGHHGISHKPCFLRDNKVFAIQLAAVVSPSSLPSGRPHDRRAEIRILVILGEIEERGNPFVRSVRVRADVVPLEIPPQAHGVPILRPPVVDAILYLAVLKRGVEFLQPRLPKLLVREQPSELGPKLHVHEFRLCAGEFALGAAHAVHGLRAVPEFPGDRDLVAVAIVWQLLIRCSGWQPRQEAVLIEGWLEDPG